jgi:hypothetical protein
LAAELRQRRSSWLSSMGLSLEFCSMEAVRAMDWLWLDNEEIMPQGLQGLDECRLRVV